MKLKEKKNGKIRRIGFYFPIWYPPPPKPSMQGGKRLLHPLHCLNCVRNYVYKFEYIILLFHRANKCKVSYSPWLTSNHGRILSKSRASAYRPYN